MPALYVMSEEAVMFILFLRALILYILVFIVIRIMGKRQVSELQPFDLVFTLLIADLASNPIGDTNVPLLYGVIPILALFLMQQLINFLSLKSARARTLLAGKPQILVAHGVLQEDTMRKSSYTITDLMEQLRAKDVFDISDVSYAIIETDGTLSVLLAGGKQQPTLQDMNLQAHTDELSEMLILDGRICGEILRRKGLTLEWLSKQLSMMGFKSSKDVFFASYSPDGQLHVQAYQKYGGHVRNRQAIQKKAGNANG